MKIYFHLLNELLLNDLFMVLVTFGLFTRFVSLCKALSLFPHLLSSGHIYSAMKASNPLDDLIDVTGLAFIHNCKFGTPLILHCNYQLGNYDQC